MFTVCFAIWLGVLLNALPLDHLCCWGVCDLDVDWLFK